MTAFKSSRIVPGLATAVALLLAAHIGLAQETGDEPEDPPAGADNGEPNNAVGEAVSATAKTIKDAEEEDKDDIARSLKDIARENNEGYQHSLEVRESNPAGGDVPAPPDVPAVVDVPAVPEVPGRPDDVGRPDIPGSPIIVVRPDVPGPPEVPGRPDFAGPPDRPGN